MKLSFNTSRKSSKPTTKSTFNFNAEDKINDEEHRSASTPVYVTEFDPTKTLTDSTKTLTVPPLQNQWRPSKRMKNLELPIQSNPLQFESQPKTLDDETKSGAVSYGLTIRKKQPDSNGNNDFVNGEFHDREEPQSLDERIRFREELDSLGDDPGYEDMPVEEFSKALLRGYGWSEGKGVGRNPKIVDVWLNEKRTIGKEGIGFEPNMKAKPEEIKSKLSEPAEERKGESVIRQEERGISRGNEVKNGESGCRDDEKRISDGSAKKKGHEGKQGWLISHIRVRVISKDLKGGRLYLKKGEVVDVIGPTSCDLLMDESRELIQGVDQELLETALPKRGGPVFVLSGRHKGVHGNLVERDLDREIALVRDADTHELFKVKLEQIAEYIGDSTLELFFSLWKELRQAESWDEVEQTVWGELNNYH